MNQSFIQDIAKIIAQNTEHNTNKALINNTPEALKASLDLDKVSPNSWQETLTWAGKYYQHCLNTAHPNFANRMWSGANPPSQLGEIIVALTNTSNCTFESAPVATMMENYMIEQMLNLIGFTNGEGQMTTGSSNANMIAMMIARNRVLQNAKQQGLSAQTKLVAFVSVDAHYSLDKAANILGIGTDNLIKVATNKNGQMDLEALEKSIKSVQQQGNIAFFVCATLGTTVQGAYDNISDLVQLRTKHNFWLHGDGAWGGAVLMSDKLRQKFLPEVEHLDSFTMDFHKMLGANLMCNFLLLNHQHLLEKTCTEGDNSYIFRDKNLDLGRVSLQCGRRVDSLKWFLDWKFYGKQGFAERVEYYYQLAQVAETLIENSADLEMISKRAAFNLCFRFKTDKIDANVFNQRLRDKLCAEHIALLSLAYVRGQLIFRLLISNTQLNKSKLSALFNHLIQAGRAQSRDKYS